LIGCGLTALANQPLSAQVEDEPERWKISAEFSFTDQSGSTVLRLLTGGLKVSHLQREYFRLDTSVQSRYGKIDGERVALNHAGSVAFDFRPEGYWSPFVFADAERDDLKRLDLRLSSGAGAKRTLRRSENGDESSVSLALLYAYESIAAPDPEAGEIRGPVRSEQLARWSLRARTAVELREGVTLRHTTFYQPIWDELADYLLRSDTGFKVLLTERLALSADYQVKRDSRPPEGVSRNDRLLTTGLIIEF